MFFSPMTLFMPFNTQIKFMETLVAYTYSALEFISGHGHLGQGPGKYVIVYRTINLLFIADDGFLFLRYIPCFMGIVNLMIRIYVFLE